MQIPAARMYFPEEDRKKLLEQIDGILESGQLTLGKYTKEFEKKFAQYVGTKHAIAVSSGTSTPEIILRALDIEGVTPIEIPPETKSNYYKYATLLKEGIDRVALKKEMREKYNVGLSSEVYELPCHLQPIFKDKYGFKGGEFPVTEDLCQRQICLPVFARMTEEQARYVVDSLREVIR